MDRSETACMAFGGTLFGLGGAGLLTLLIYSQTPDAKAGGHTWFLLAVALSGLIAVTGAYFVAAVWLPVPVPQTRTERALKPDLVVEGIRVIETADDAVVFQINFGNRGRGDVLNASVNVLVPDFVTELIPWNEFGLPVDFGSVSHTTEPFYRSEDGKLWESWIWGISGYSFPGRIRSPFRFRAAVSGQLRLPVGYKVGAEALRKTLIGTEVLELTPRAEPPADVPDRAPERAAPASQDPRGASPAQDHEHGAA